jgi:hypothetical protein
VTLQKLNLSATTANNFYTLAITKITPLSYLLVAKPLGLQAKYDTACSSLTLDQCGQKGATGSLPTECW